MPSSTTFFRSRGFISYIFVDSIILQFVDMTLQRSSRITSLAVVELRSIEVSCSITSAGGTLFLACSSSFKSMRWWSSTPNSTLFTFLVESGAYFGLFRVLRRMDALFYGHIVPKISLFRRQGYVFFLGIILSRSKETFLLSFLLIFTIDFSIHHFF